MKKTFLSRLSGVVAALALGGSTLAVVGAATPASAADIACTTTVEISPSYRQLEFGRTNSVQAQAIGSCPGYKSGRLPYGTAGNLVIQKSTDGRTWSNVGGNTSAGSAYASVPASGSMYLRAYRPTGTYRDGDDVLTFPGKPSTAVRVSVIRKVDMRFKGGRGKVKSTFIVSPAASVAGTKALVQIKKGKKWKKYTKVKFRGNGRVVKRFGKTGRYRLVLPTSRGFDGFTYGFRIYRY
jgi:hypothetical protein